MIALILFRLPKGHFVICLPRHAYYRRLSVLSRLSGWFLLRSPGALLLVH